MSEREDSLTGDNRSQTGVITFPGVERDVRRVAFDRTELFEILKLYGRKVAEGEWRDYAIDHLDTIAVFSIFRRTAEAPLYRIEKNPKLANKQGLYAVVAQGGLVLKRGQDLSRVLAVIDRKPKLVEV